MKPRTCRKCNRAATHHVPHGEHEGHWFCSEHMPERCSVCNAPATAWSREHDWQTATPYCPEHFPGKIADKRKQPMTGEEIKAAFLEFDKREKRKHQTRWQLIYKGLYELEPDAGVHREAKLLLLVKKWAGIDPSEYRALPEMERQGIAREAVDKELGVRDGTKAPPPKSLGRNASKIYEHYKSAASFPTQERIRSELQMGSDTVSKALKELRACGLWEDGRNKIGTKQE